MKKYLFNPFQLFFFVFAYAKKNGLNFTLQKIFQKSKRLLLQPFQHTSDQYFQELQDSLKKSHLYKEFKDYSGESQTPQNKIICFYLPQFHPFKENDEFWGRGFTEWTNVSKSFPLFKNHYQPRLPADLGFYDLRLAETINQQAIMAKNYGVFGFCFHYYWFSGHKVMDAPIDLFYENKDIDLNYCICWANENWTRRWDGNDQDVLLKQLDTKEDYLNFIQDVSKYFHDSRYIKVNNCPLLILYRAELLKDPKLATEIWRNHAKSLGFPDLHLVLTESFGEMNPSDYGFDCAVDFSPNSYKPQDITSNQKFYTKNFAGHVFDYKSLITESLKKNKPNFYHSLCLGWDNSARKSNKASIFQDYSPLLFGEWLSLLLKKKPLNDITFVNAWNEWAEGTYLEPDRRFGYAALQQVRDAIFEDSLGKKIIVLVHDAHFHGAQLLALNIVKTLKIHFNAEVVCIIKTSGELIEEFARHSTVYLSNEIDRNKIIELEKRGYNQVFANSVASADLLTLFEGLSFEVVSLIHEMPLIIKNMHFEKALALANKTSRFIVYPNQTVAKVNLDTFSLDSTKAITIGQGLFSPAKWTHSDILSQKNGKTILGIGYGDLRKGFDLFIETAHSADKRNLDYNFIWIGNYDPAAFQKVKKEFSEISGKNFTHLPPQKNLSPYYKSADLFLLTSREDPNPSVVLEALSNGLPVVSWESSGGAAEIILNHHVGEVYKDQSSTSIIATIEKTIRKKSDYQSACKEYTQNILKSSNQYVFDLIRLTDTDLKKISVMLYIDSKATDLKSKFENVINQTYPIYEISVVDDAQSEAMTESIFKLMDRYPLMKFRYSKPAQSSQPLEHLQTWLDKLNGDFIWVTRAEDQNPINFLKDNVLNNNDEASKQMVFKKSALPRKEYLNP